LRIAVGQGVHPDKLGAILEKWPAGVKPFFGTKHGGGLIHLPPTEAGMEAQ